MNTLLAQGAVFFNKSKNTFIYGSLIIFTLVLEEVFQKGLFRCPCRYHFQYGMLFLFGPTAFLFMVGILINKKTWKLLVVLRRQPKKTDDDNDLKKRCARLPCICGEILFKALLSPIVWLILSFLQKNFFVCAVYGPSVTKQVGDKAKLRSTPHICHKATKSAYSEAQLMAYSQMCAIGLLIASTFIVLLAVLIAQCFKRNRNLHLPNMAFYKRIEAKAAAKEFHKVAKEQAQNRGKKSVEIVLGNLNKMNSKNDDYLGILSKTGAILDYEYSRYYSDLDPLVEHQGRDGATHDQTDQSPQQSPDCIFQDSTFFESYVAVDGRPHKVHFDSEVKVVHETSSSCSSSTSRDPRAKSSIDIKKQYCFKRSYSVD